MLQDAENLLEPRSSSSRRLLAANQFIDSNRRRRFRFFTTILAVCFILYLLTSVMFLTQDRKVDPLTFRRPKPIKAIINPSISGSNTVKAVSPNILSKLSKETAVIGKLVHTQKIFKDGKSRLAQACKIPVLDPFHPSIKNALYEKVVAPTCESNFPLMFETDFDSNLIQLNSTKLLQWRNCCYRVITRNDNASNPDNSEKIGSFCHKITSNRTKIPSDREFIGIYCTYENKTGTPKPKMIDAFAFTHLKSHVEKRINKTQNTKKSKLKNQFNVVILGLDAVSHMNFKRTVPKVLNYLIKDLDAVGMNGYTKIGDNTYPNIIAALTSWNLTEVKKKCFSSKASFFDDCPFLWKNFSQEGYITSYGEDSAWMGIFNYLMKGFKKSPTDFYLRPISGAIGKFIAHEKRGNANICYGPRMSLDFLLNYMKKLAYTMGQAKRYFQFIWSTGLTHDFVSQGKLGELSVLSTLQWLKDEGYLNNTVFILMSDHGIRWGPVREVPQGKVEENMPFLYFVFPERFKKKYKSAIANIKANQNQLTSPFDTFETLKDILYIETISDENLREREKKLSALTESNIPRGISLFLPVPKFRTCKTAGIAEHYCVCHSSQMMSTENDQVRQMANYAVYTLNSYVANYSSCAYLALSSVIHAQLNLPDKKNVTREDKIFEVVFTTDPGKGMFEATVVKDWKGKISMSGSISRTNVYGNQSHCVDDKEMKKYCYCLKSR